MDLFPGKEGAVSWLSAQEVFLYLVPARATGSPRRAGDGRRAALAAYLAVACHSLDTNTRLALDSSTEKKIRTR